MDTGENIDIIRFDELYPLRKVTLINLEKRGVAWLLANEAIRKYNPCMAVSAYFYYKNIQYIKPKAIGRDESGALIGAEFDDFMIVYDDAIEWYDFIATGDTSKYGKDFEDVAKRVIGMMNEDGVCRTLLTAITKYEAGTIDLTEEGIRALYTIAALMIETIRARNIRIKLEEEEIKKKPKVTTVVAPTEDMPELAAVANMIGFIAQKYNLSIDEVIEKVRGMFRK